MLRVCVVVLAVLLSTSVALRSGLRHRPRGVTVLGSLDPFQAPKLTKSKMVAKNEGGAVTSDSKSEAMEPVAKSEKKESERSANMWGKFEPPKGVPGGAARRGKMASEVKARDVKEAMNEPPVPENKPEPEPEPEPMSFYNQPKQIETRAMRKQRVEDEMRANGTFTSYLSRMQDEDEVKPWSLADTIGVNSTTLRALFDLQTEITNFFTKISKGFESVAVLVSTKVERDLRTVGLSGSYVSRRTTKEIRKLTGGKADEDRGPGNPFALPSSVSDVVKDDKARLESKALIAKGINPMDIVNRGKGKSQLLGGVATGGSTKERVAIRKKRKGGVFSSTPTAAIAETADSTAKDVKKRSTWVDLSGPDAVYRSVRVLPEKLKYDYQRRERKQQVSGTRAQQVQTVTKLLQDSSDILVSRKELQLGDGAAALTESDSGTGVNEDGAIDIVGAETSVAVITSPIEAEGEEIEDEGEIKAVAVSEDADMKRFLEQPAVAALVDTLASTSTDGEEDEVISLARVSPEISTLLKELGGATDQAGELSGEMQALQKAREASERVVAAAAQAVRLADTYGDKSAYPVTFCEDTLLSMEPTDARAVMDGLWVVAEGVRKASSEDSVYAGVYDRCGRDEDQRSSLLNSFKYVEKLSKVMSKPDLMDARAKRIQELAEPEPEPEPEPELEPVVMPEPQIDLSSFTFSSAFEDDDEDEVEVEVAGGDYALVASIIITTKNEGQGREPESRLVSDVEVEPGTVPVVEGATGADSEDQGPLVIDTEAETTATTEERVASALVQSIDVGFFLLETVGRAVGPVLSDGGKVLSMRYKQMLQPDQRVSVRKMTRTKALRKGTGKGATGDNASKIKQKNECREEKKDTRDIEEATTGKWRLPTGLRNAKAFQP